MKLKIIVLSLLILLVFPLACYANVSMVQVGLMANHLQLGYGNDGYVYYQTDVTLNSNDYYHVDILKQDGTTAYSETQWGSSPGWNWTGVKGVYNSTYTMQATVYDGYTDSWVASWGTASLKILPPTPIVTSISATADSALLSQGSSVSVIATYSDGSRGDISTASTISAVLPTNPVSISGNSVSILNSYPVNLTINYNNSTYNPNNISTSLVLNYVTGNGGVGKVTEAQADTMISLLKQQINGQDILTPNGSFHILYTSNFGELMIITLLIIALLIFFYQWFRRGR